jgi:hypothetical protein
MSVFWDEGRKDLEAYARAAAGPPDGKPSPKNYFIRPSPDQMLRVMVGLGLKRGKLEAVHAAFRGRVPSTGVIDPAPAERPVFRGCRQRATLRSTSTGGIISWAPYRSPDTGRSG